MSAEEIRASKLQRALILTCFGTSIAILPGISFDPINNIKMTVLVIGAFSQIPTLASRGFAFGQTIEKVLLILCSLLIGLLTFSFIFSTSPWELSFWGTAGRNTGYLTLVSLTLLVLMGQVAAKILGVVGILSGFTLCSVPISIYGLFQALEIDPFPWSQRAIFSTLGNINFSSAYFAMVSVASLFLALICKKDLQSKVKTLLLVLYSMGNAWLSLVTTSIQGPVLIFSTIVLIFSILTLRSFSSKFAITLFLFSIISFALVFVFGAFGHGPLGRVLLQQTLLFRSDYWRAGISMIADSPLLGKGPDSYGEWYRRFRDITAVTRTGPERTANTSHNIFIDMGVNSGFFASTLLLFIFLTPLFLVLRRSLSLIKLDLGVLAIWSLTAMYFLQAQISINQIGISSWGWLFAGSLWAAARQPESQTRIKDKINSRPLSSPKTTKKALTSSPSEFLNSTLFLAIGVVLIFPALNSDIKVYSAIKSGDATSLISASKMTGSNLAHKEEAVFRMSSLPAENRKDYVREVVERYPSSIYSWRVLYDLTEPGSNERINAAYNLRSLDPLNDAILP